MQKPRQHHLTQLQSRRLKNQLHQNLHLQNYLEDYPQHQQDSEHHQLGQCESAIPDEGSSCIQWEDCMEKIDLVALASKEHILFYDEIILYEDELSDNGVSLLTVKVRVMPSG
ncbi:hypothetical protein K7X08_006963 [Anisodus acutangulus]|uniref:Uncharacterized protein n=1 Tax=Anisodus acutangulus TaxID=402998 RepID=A0A9Q1LEH1_9SOLA|nr:hypothetical protein K7X08_006963 [Anisodus acutangulus]